MDDPQVCVLCKQPLDPDRRVRYSGGETRHCSTFECIDALLAQIAEWQRKYNDLLESVKYLRKDAPAEYAEEVGE